jgi:arginase
MRVDLIAVPYDSGRRGERMGAGPLILQVGLAERLTAAGHDVRTSTVETPAGTWCGEIRAAFELARGVAAGVREAAAAGAFPLILSGNCGPAAMGGVAAQPTPPAVCWFDAHGDFNTPDTTAGGFLDGMALAILAGKCFPELARGIAGLRPIEEESVALIGARDLDPLEAQSLNASAIRQVAAAELRQQLPPALAALGRRQHVYVHLDLDVLDPSEGRVNGYAAPGGLSRADVVWALERIAAELRVGAASLTAFDPAADPGGRALDAALSLGVAMVQTIAAAAPR